jgi:hypothetical protein
MPIPAADGSYGSTFGLRLPIDDFNGFPLLTTQGHMHKANAYVSSADALRDRGVPVSYEPRLQAMRQE